MPELPEVENVRIQLERFLIGHKIEKVDIKYKKCFTGDHSKLTGGKVREVQRFGKALSIDLDNGYSIIIHIKMTGQLIYQGPNSSKILKTPDLSKRIIGGLNGKHTHVIYYLDKGGILYFNDVRKFGWIKVIKSDKKNEISYVNNLGPEPSIKGVMQVEILSLDKFVGLRKSTKRIIKTLIMDQSKISGVGNIYANDALWLAGIHPERESSSLSRQEAKKLLRAIEKVLKEGLESGGSSQNSYVRPDGTDGKYQFKFLVYDREEKKCLRCKVGEIKKMKLGGRGTYYCPNCQKK